MEAFTTEDQTYSTADVEESEAATKEGSDETNIPTADKDPNMESDDSADLNTNDIFH